MSRLFDDNDLEDGDDATVQGWAKDDKSSIGGIIASCKRDGNSKRFVLTAALVLAVVLLLVGVGLFATRKEVDASSKENPLSRLPVSPIPEGAVTETFLVGSNEDFSQPLEIPILDMWGRTFASPRPLGDIAVHQIHLSTVDEDYNLIPEHILYNHHSLILADQAYFAAFGSEGARSYISFPPSYAVILRKNQNLTISMSYIPLMGMISMSPPRVFANFTLVYSRLDADNDGVISDEESKKWKPLSNAVTGIYRGTSREFDVPGGGGKGSIYCESATLRWRRPNATLVHVLGHLHIGSINLTLTDKTNNQVIAATAPLYDQNGFLLRVGGSYVEYRFVKDNEYTTTACYHNERPYLKAMGVWELFYYQDPSTLHFSYNRDEQEEMLEEV